MSAGDDRYMQERWDRAPESRHMTEYATGCIEERARAVAIIEATLMRLTEADPYQSAAQHLWNTRRVETTNAKI